MRRVETSKALCVKVKRTSKSGRAHILKDRSVGPLTSSRQFSTQHLDQPPSILQTQDLQRRKHQRRNISLYAADRQALRALKGRPSTHDPGPLAHEPPRDLRRLRIAALANMRRWRDVGGGEVPLGDRREGCFTFRLGRRRRHRQVRILGSRTTARHRKREERRVSGP